MTTLDDEVKEILTEIRDALERLSPKSADGPKRLREVEPFGDPHGHFVMHVDPPTEVSPALMERLIGHD